MDTVTNKYEHSEINRSTSPTECREQVPAISSRNMPLLHADLRCEEGAKMITILYVDDEPALLELVRLFLERSGEFRVATSTSAREALANPAIRSYDAIISDYQMPDMDGIAFLKAVREQFGEMPFILFTGKGREEVVIEAINNGADCYVQKGGDPKALFADLAHKVRQAVRRRRAEASLAEQEQRNYDLQNANDLIQSVAPDGHFLFVNAKWLDTLGYTAEDLPDLTIFDVIHEESIDHCTDLFRRVAAGENVGFIDAVFTTRDGRKVYVEGKRTARSWTVNAGIPGGSSRTSPSASGWKRRLPRTTASLTGSLPRSRAES